MVVQVLQARQLIAIEPPGRARCGDLVDSALVDGHLATIQQRLDNLSAVAGVRPDDASQRRDAMDLSAQSNAKSVIRIDDALASQPRIAEEQLVGPFAAQGRLDTVLPHEPRDHHERDGIGHVGVGMLVMPHRGRQFADEVACVDLDDVEVELQMLAQLPRRLILAPRPDDVGVKDGEIVVELRGHRHDQRRIDASAAEGADRRIGEELPFDAFEEQLLHPIDELPRTLLPQALHFAVVDEIRDRAVGVARRRLSASPRDELAGRQRFDPLVKRESLRRAAESQQVRRNRKRIRLEGHPRTKRFHL